MQRPWFLFHRCGDLAKAPCKACERLQQFSRCFHLTASKSFTSSVSSSCLTDTPAPVLTPDGTPPVCRSFLLRQNSSTGGCPAHSLFSLLPQPVVSIMSLPTPPTRAHIPASSFPAIETPPSAQGISSSSPSPFQSPDISRPPSPSQVNSSRPTASRGTSQVPSEDSRWAASRSGSLSKDPLVKKSRPFVASPSLWERVKGLVPGSGAAAEEQRGRRPSVLAEGGERMVQQDGRWKVGWPMSREKAQLVLSFAMIALVSPTSLLEDHVLTLFLHRSA